MKKKFYWSILLLLLLVMVLTPFIIGIFLQQKYEQFLNQFSQNIKVDLKLIRFNRSWFYSDAIIATNFPLTDRSSETLDKQDALIIRQRIYHGPVILQVDKLLPHLKFVLVYVDSFFDPKHHFAETTWTINNTLKTHLALNEYCLKRNSKLIYSLTGLGGDITNNPKNKNFSVNIVLKHLFANLDSPREITNFSTEQHGQYVANFWTGSKRYHFDLLKWQQEERNFTFKNFNYMIDTKLHDDDVKIQLQTRIDSVLLNNRNYGAQNIALSLNNLNAQKLKLLQDYFQTPPGVANASGSFRQQIMNLLNKGADIKIDTLSLNTVWGPVNLQGSIYCPCQNNTNNFSNLFSKVRKKVQGQLPIELASTFLTNYFFIHQVTTDLPLAKKAAEVLLADWEKAGWLKNSGNTFIINLN